MSRNGSGTFSVPNTFVSGNTITASGHNQNWSDIASEMTNSVAADGQTTMTGPLKAANGTALAPSVTFASDTDTGVYRIGGNNIGVACNGAKVMDIATTGVTVTGDVNSTTLKQGGFAAFMVGEIKIWPGSSIPSGFLACQGQSLLRATYPDLFTAIGTTYGAADGTHFTLPDLGGRVVAGKEATATRLTTAVGGVDGATLNSAAGSQSNTLASANLPNTTLTTSTTVTARVISTLAGGGGSSALDQLQLAGGGGTLSQAFPGTTSSINGNVSQTAHANVQPTIVLNYIIFAGV